MLYGDILFERGHLEKLLKSPAEISLVVDRAWTDRAGQDDSATGRGEPDLVQLKDPQEAGYRFVGAEAPHRVARVGRNVAPAQAQGEFIGMALLSEKGARQLSDLYTRLVESKKPVGEAASLKEASFTDIVQELINGGAEVQALDVYKGWLEIDTFDDYKRAWALIKE